MANGIYSKAKQNYNFPAIVTDAIKVVLTRTYAPNFGTDEFLSAILVGERVATSGNMTGKTFVGGLYKADGVTFSAVLAGAACNYFIFYYDTGVAATSPLICGLDTGITGMPVTPDGSNIVVTWAAGGIFQI